MDLNTLSATVKTTIFQQSISQPGPESEVVLHTYKALCVFLLQLCRLILNYAPAVMYFCGQIYLCVRQ